MDAPPVQYARTSDGVNIAYTVAGSGRPYVDVPSMEWYSSHRPPASWPLPWWLVVY